MDRTDQPTSLDAVSRRQFVTAAAALALGASSGGAAPQTITAQQLVDRVRVRLGAAIPDGTPDGFRAGDPGARVSGVAVTAMATLDVLRRAADARHDLVLTLAPVFYTPGDTPDGRAADPVYLAKRALIEERKLVVFRFGEHWRARRPDERTRALAAALGWAGTASADDARLHDVPPVTVADVVRRARAELGARGGVRLIGDPRATVRRVAVAPGTIDLATAVRLLQRADLLVTGEAREWEGIEYAFDAGFAGRPKALLALGLVLSEEPGVRACAEWLRTVVPEVPARAIAVGDPYWSPVA
jgi:putative NIF3 family GTP cyclohydrolase 1 type 2